MAVPPTPVRVPSERLLAPSITSVTSVANDKDDNEMIPGAVLGDLLMKVLCDQLSPRMGSLTSNRGQ